MSRVFYTKPSITDLEVAYATDAARNGWGADCYAYIERFERAFARKIGVEHAVATSSCTGALHLGLAALGVGAGDEVIIGDINWIASVAPVVHVGATPVFVDVKSGSWCIDPARVEEAITPRTKAIIAVHLYGNLAEMDALRAIADARGLHLIEDAAEAIGSRIGERAAGSMGDFATFSFHGTKTLTTGEGGMFVTSDAALHDKVATLNNHGRSKLQPKQFWADMVGFKYKMSNLQAAVGLAQLERVDDLIARKREIFGEYEDGLSGLPIAMNPQPAGTTNGYWMPTVVVNSDVDFSRDRLMAAFAENDIDGRVFFWPLSSLPMFRDRPENRVSYSLFGRAFNLPSYHDISSADIARVCEVVRTCLP